ncbi:MAG: murein L,D-transpeptidase [Patescibacteria group bacterium]
MTAKIVIVLLMLNFYPNSIKGNETSDFFEMQKLEVGIMDERFKTIVGNKINLDEEYLQIILADMAKIIGKESQKKRFNKSQYFVYIDRNPKKQLVFLCFYDALTKNIRIIGADKTSTGNPKRKGHFITPTGVFENSVKNFNYRALGTKNDQGWRGLGIKGSRVWDFGWQETNYKSGKRYIRLLMHATDPNYGEPRLGKVDSKGCIRISAKFNKFLDYYGVLDADYERNKKSKSVLWLLKHNREPVLFAGQYLITGDSSSPNT